MSRCTTPVLVILAVLLLAPTIATRAASTPYIISIVDRDSWVAADTVSVFTYVSVYDTASLCVWIDPVSGAEDFDGGFDFLISYDAYVMTLLDVTRGPDLSADWEYFNYRFGPGDSCAGCPSGLVRIVGVCDYADGITPPDAAYNLTGCIAELIFAAGPDMSQQPYCHHVDFYSLDCSDNVISSRHGDSLYIPLSGDVRGPGYDSVGCPDAGHPYIDFQGAQVCIGGGDEPPDTLPVTRYHIGIMDRESWVQLGSALPSIWVDGGGSATTCVWVDPGDSLQEGGFDFLIEFDASAMTLSGVAMGSDLADEWEYFSYTPLSGDACTGCPNGLVRIVGVCDVNDGTTPPEEAYNLAGCVAELTFTATDDLAAAGTCHTVGFYSVDCGDNTIASRAGDLLYIPLAGDNRNPAYDSAACAASGLPAIDYTSGLFCINDVEVPPDTLDSPYEVGIIDRTWWVSQDSVLRVILAPAGSDAVACLWVDPASGGARAEGGFDFLILYGSDMLTLQNVSRGPDLSSEWEYFTWRTTITADSCLGPSLDLVRVVGIADLLNATTPPNEAFNLSGCIAELAFYVGLGPEQFTACSPIGFYAMDCGDNAISTRVGDSLFIPMSGVSHCGFDPGSCIVSGDSLTSATPAIRFASGQICSYPSTTGGGDINLNGIANEIGDLVLYSNFFIYGPVVFDTATIDQQILQSEVNCDGLTLTTMDWTYMTNIIVGNLTPCNSGSPVRRSIGGLLAASASQTPSTVDTMQIMDVAAVPGQVFAVELNLRNVDTLCAFNFRLRFDPTQIEPVTDTVYGPRNSMGAVNLYMLRDGAFEVAAAGLVDPGVVTFFAGDFDAGLTDAFLPGQGPTLRMLWRVLPTVGDTLTMIVFENDPVYPHTYNTMTDLRAAFHKRPVLINGMVTIGGGGTCDCAGRCDFDEDGFLTSIDLAKMINVLYAGQAEPQNPDCPVGCGDFDGDFQTTAIDLSLLIDHLFAGQAAPSDPCTR